MIIELYQQKVPGDEWAAVGEEALVLYDLYNDRNYYPSLRFLVQTTNGTLATLLRRANQAGISLCFHPNRNINVLDSDPTTTDCSGGLNS